jgi:hypothetical protein
MLDQIDGGISLLLRTPGYCVSSNVHVEDVTIDTYISPHEIHFNGPRTQEKVALLVQQFGMDIALPHLCCFTGQCQDKGITEVKKPCSCLTLTIALLN